MITTTQIAEALSAYETENARTRGWSSSSAPAAPVYAQGWPAGVVARYLTLGHAHADVTYEPSRGLRAHCTACPWTHYEHFEVLGSDTPEDAATKVAAYLPDARAEAQEHAEICRAVPVPHPEAGGR